MKTDTRLLIYINKLRSSPVSRDVAKSSWLPANFIAQKKSLPPAKIANKNKGLAWEVERCSSVQKPA